MEAQSPAAADFPSRHARLLIADAALHIADMEVEVAGASSLTVY
jgi:hypothetical protein